MRNEEILEDYPDLEDEDIRACLSYAASMIKLDGTFALVS